MAGPELGSSTQIETVDITVGAKIARFWRQYGWLIAVLLLVVFGRLWGIGQYSLDWDECNELAIAKLPVFELIRVIYSRDIHPPAAHIFTHVWLALVGDSDLKVRILYASYGLLGLWGSYLLAGLLKASKRVAIYTVLLGIFCPFVWHYTHLATHHAFFYATAMFSWVFFLRLLQEERISWRKPALWAYLLMNVICLYTQSIAPFLLLSQAVFLFWQHRAKFYQQPALWLGLGAIFLIAYLPQLWAISQPWHPSKMKEMGEGVHGAPSWGTLFFMPAQLLWMGDDQAFQPLIPNWDRLLIYGGLGTLMLWYACQSLKRKLPQAIPLGLCMTVLPVCLLFLVSITMGLHVLHGRAILYATFPVLLAMAVWIDGIEKKLGAKRALPILFGVMFAQLWLDLTFIELPTNKASVDFKQIVKSMQPLLRPGDGFLVTPGYMGLGILRYLDPPRFGLTESELHMDPRRENLFHLVQRIDDTYFFVSGRDVQQRPEVREAFKAFQRTHPRIWYRGDLRDYNDEMDCQPTFIVRGPDKRYWQVHCSFLSPRHCRAPLTGPGANHWQCNADLETR